jgi:hypothetical protein
MSFNTHQELFEVLFHNIVQHTDLGQWCATADLPGYRWYERDDVGNRISTDEISTRLGITYSSSDEDEPDLVNAGDEWYAQRQETHLTESNSDTDPHTDASDDQASNASWTNIMQTLTEMPDFDSDSSQSDKTYLPSEDPSSELSDYTDSQSEQDNTPPPPLPNPMPGRGAQTSIWKWLDSLPPSEQTKKAEPLPPGPAATAMPPHEPAAEPAAPSEPPHARSKRQQVLKKAGVLEIDVGTYTEPEPKSEPHLKSRAEIEKLLSKNGCCKTGLPKWAGVPDEKGLSRPDAIIIQGCRWRDRNRTPSKAARDWITFHLFEFTRTSEAYFQESRTKKKEQHQKLVNLLRARGFKVQLHVLQMGCRGHMPTSTLKTLHVLPNKDKKLNKTRVSRMYKILAIIVTITKAYGMVRLRRQLEKQPDLRHGNTHCTKKHGWEQTELLGTSGLLAVTEAKRRLKLLKREKQPGRRPN